MSHHHGRSPSARTGSIPAPKLGVVCAFVALIAGCREEPIEATPGEPAAITMSIGTGEAAFEALTEGETIPLILGPQGGYHLWISVRCDGCSDLAILGYGARDSTSGEPLSYESLEREIAYPYDGGTTDVFGLVGHLQSNDPSSYVGRSAVLWASIRPGPDEEPYAEARAAVTIGEEEHWHP